MRCSNGLPLRCSIALLFLPLLLVGCVDRTEPTIAPEVFLPHPELPLGPEGKEVANASAAGLPFVPIRLRRPNATSEWVHLAKEVRANAAALVYSTPAWGDVVVLETPDPETQDELLSCDGCTSDPFERVDLPRGVTAILASNPYTTTISWIEPMRLSEYGRRPDTELNLNVMVTGISDRVSHDEIAAIAERLVRSA